MKILHTDFLFSDKNKNKNINKNIICTGSYSPTMPTMSEISQTQAVERNFVMHLAEKIKHAVLNFVYPQKENTLKQMSSTYAVNGVVTRNPSFKAQKKTGTERVYTKVSEGKNKNASEIVSPSKIQPGRQGCNKADLKKYFAIIGNNFSQANKSFTKNSAQVNFSDLRKKILEVLKQYPFDNAFKANLAVFLHILQNSTKQLNAKNVLGSKQNQGKQGFLNIVEKKDCKTNRNSHFINNKNITALDLDDKKIKEKIHIKQLVKKNNGFVNRAFVNEISLKSFLYYLYLASILKNINNNKTPNSKSKSVNTAFDFSKKQKFVHQKTHSADFGHKSIQDINKEIKTDKAEKDSSKNFDKNYNIKNNTDNEVEKFYYTLSLLADSSLNSFVERFSDGEDNSEIENRLENTCNLVDYISHEGVSHAVIKDFIKLHFDYFGNYHNDAIEPFRVLKNNVESQKQTADKIINVLEHYKNQDKKDKTSAVKKLEKAFKQYGLDGNNDFKSYNDYLDYINMQNEELYRTLLSSIKTKSDKCDLNTILDFVCRYQNYGLYIEHLYESVSVDKEIEQMIYKQFVDARKNAPEPAVNINDKISGNLKLIKENEQHLDAPSKRLVKQINSDTCDIVENLGNHCSTETAVKTAKQLAEADYVYLNVLKNDIVKNFVKNAQKDSRWTYKEKLTDEDMEKIFYENNFDTNSQELNNINKEITQTIDTKGFINKAAIIKDLKNNNREINNKAGVVIGRKMTSVHNDASQTINKKQSVQKEVKIVLPEKQLKSDSSKNAVQDNRCNFDEKREISINTLLNEQNKDKTIEKSNLKSDLQLIDFDKEFIEIDHQKPAEKEDNKTKQLRKTKTENKKTAEKEFFDEVLENNTHDQNQPEILNIPAVLHINSKIKHASKFNSDKKIKTHIAQDTKDKETIEVNNTIIALQTLLRINQMLTQEFSQKYSSRNSEALMQYITQLQSKRYQTAQMSTDRAKTIKISKNA